MKNIILWPDYKYYCGHVDATGPEGSTLYTTRKMCEAKTFDDWSEAYELLDRIPPLAQIYTLTNKEYFEIKLKGI